MNLEERISALETENKRLSSLLEQMNVAHDTLAKYVGGIHTMAESAGEITLHLQERIDLCEDRLSLLSKVPTDLYFVSLCTYWLCYILEQVEHITPVGTTDLILNSIEETMDPKESTFYNLYNSTRSAPVTD